MISAVGTNQSNNTAFKGIVVKNFPADVQVRDFVNFLRSGHSDRIIKGGNTRVGLDAKTFNWMPGYAKQGEKVLGATKASEDALFKDLMANKDKFPGVEIHKIDDWA